MVSMQLLIYHFLQREIIFYYGYVITLFLAACLSVNSYRKFKDFHGKTHLFILNQNPNSTLVEPLEIEEPIDKCLKACYWYRNSKSLADVAEALQLEHPQQARREVFRV